MAKDLEAVKLGFLRPLTMKDNIPDAKEALGEHEHKNIIFIITSVK